jgi:hypothetical protein
MSCATSITVRSFSVPTLYTSPVLPRRGRRPLVAPGAGRGAALHAGPGTPPASRSSRPLWHHQPPPLPPPPHLVQDGVERARHVLHVQVGAHRVAVAVDGQVGTAARAQDELGDELLGELVGAVHVVAARDDDGHLVAEGVGWGGGVGAARCGERACRAAAACAVCRPGGRPRRASAPPRPAPRAGAVRDGRGGTKRAGPCARSNPFLNLPRPRSGAAPAAAPAWTAAFAVVTYPSAAPALPRAFRCAPRPRPRPHTPTPAACAHPPGHVGLAHHLGAGLGGGVGVGGVQHRVLLQAWEGGLKRRRGAGEVQARAWACCQPP